MVDFNDEDGIDATEVIEALLFHVVIVKVILTQALLSSMEY